MKTTNVINRKEVKTWLPIFNGFYNTIFEADETNEIDDINSQRESLGLDSITYDDCIFDYTEYYNKVGKKCCEFIESKIKEIGIECKIVYEAIDSPREYNFRNDSINCTIDIDVNKLFTLFTENKEELKQYFLDKYTSRSGFISFHSNNINEWIENFAEYCEDSHKLASIIESILEYKNESDDILMDMYYYCMDSGECFIYASNYNELTENK